MIPRRRLDAVPKARSAPGRRVVLVGAGHAHLHLLRRAAEFARRGFGLTVIAPDDFWYSGAATGVLGGHYPPEFERIDIAAVLAGSGATLVRGRLSGLDLESRQLLVDGGCAIPFDVVSLNLGSAPPMLPGNHRSSFDVKPVVNLHRLRMALDAWHRERPGDRPRIAVVGGGMTGVEIAANLDRLASRMYASFAIGLYTSGRVLRELPVAAAEGVVRALQRRGVDIVAHSRVLTVDDRCVTLADSRTHRADFVVNATGLEPAHVTRALGLPIDGDGALVVDASLASTGSSIVFAAGDCIAFRGVALPRVGVYAVRQAPILLHNLLATLEGRPLLRFEPQRHFLAIMNLGDGTGLAVRAGYRWRGRLAWRLKNAIDEKFLAEYRPENALGAIRPESIGLTRSQP